MVDSIHAARWAKQFDPKDVEFTLFPSGPNRRVHPIFKELDIPIVPFGGFLSVPLWAADRIFGDQIRGLLLRFAIKRINPDFIHALELQHAGYVTSKALKDKKIQTTFIATNYGSDIYWFQQFPLHLVKIKEILNRADRYSAECNRDIELAKKYGFSGKVMPVFPNAGGFTDEQLKKTLVHPSQRQVIAIKGYEGWVGRASVAVEALYSLTQELASFKIIFYSCNIRTIKLLQKAKKATGLNIHWHKKGKLSHQQVLDLFASARIYLGLSLSDGISTSLLEAMAMGAFPVQTTTACVDEWITPGETGIAVSSLSSADVIYAIKSAVAVSSAGSDFQRINRDRIRDYSGNLIRTNFKKEIYAE
jgi:glycosyltransferase involved in cell wall biosynthesis